VRSGPVKITSVRAFIVDGAFWPWAFVRVETSEPGLGGWVAQMRIYYEVQ
jgi:hypothetical protein